MTTQLDRPLYGFRFAEILFNDSLQLIAARELGDAARWPELIAYNNLVPPFVTSDPAQVKPGVLLAGQLILVPAPTPVVSSTTDPERVFEADIDLSGGDFTFVNGDLGVVSGRANLRQFLRHRIETEAGELIYHKEYGSLVRRLIGAVNGPTAALLAAEYAKSAILADPRISRVSRSEAGVLGDVINVSVEAEPIAGRPVLVVATP